MPIPVERKRYDVMIAGARCAGASTAMLLARRGLRVLVVDPARRGSDTLSTHALMRGAVLQLHRWGLLDAVRSSGTPAIRKTTFHYADEVIGIPIKERDGVDSLFAPRRTVLDSVLVEAALAAGAEVVNGQSVVDLIWDEHGRVRGARISGADRQVVDVEATLVIGADGVRSRMARILGLEAYATASHATASIYGYWSGLGLEGYHWYYDLGAAVGSIPTNDGETCVFASVPQGRFETQRSGGLEALYFEALEDVSADLAERVARSEGPGKLRAFAGEPGFLRRATGPGWALVGDAAYFRDPLTAHGITDAFREAEFLVHAALEGSDAALIRYQASRDERVRGLLAVTDQIASFEWSMQGVKDQHLVLAREMNALVDAVRSLGTEAHGRVTAASGRENAA
jgi:2-polyprenyl-6-methoxyphenol hydroxylase-like FAD-dependent oxidoreductase